MALMQCFPELHCRARMPGRDEDDMGALASYHYAFFDTMIDPHTRTNLSEDYAFCRRIASIGIMPAVDTRSNFTHQGVAVYPGDLARSLELRRAVSRRDAKLGVAS